MIRTPIVQALRSILLAQLLSLVPSATYPRFLWSQQLVGSGSVSQASLRQGNGIVLSNEATPSLWVVDDAGTLHIIEVSFAPDHKIATTSPPELSKYRTESRSRIVLHERGNHVKYGVFAVIDVPKRSNEPIRSRLITVIRSLESVSIVSSVVIEGIIEGSPVLSRGGDRIFVIHNVHRGCRISAVDIDVASGTITQVILIREGRNRCSPASIGVTNGTETLFWGEEFEAFENFIVGEIHRVTTSPPYKTLGKLPRFEGTVNQPPLVSVDGTIVWVGGNKAFIHGSDLETRSPLFSEQLPLSRRNSTQAVTSNLVDDGESNRLFVASATNSFHCLYGEHGHTAWSVTDGVSVFLSPAVYSPRDNSLYTIEHLKGRVARRDADTGEVSFHFDCTSMIWGTSCSDSVEADSTISSDGTVLFYGDIFGRINALEVADPVTLEPSSLPSPSLSPTMGPEAPSSTPIALPQQTSGPSEAPLGTVAPEAVRTQQAYDIVATTAPTSVLGGPGTPTSDGRPRKIAFALLLVGAGVGGVLSTFK